MYLLNRSICKEICNFPISHQEEKTSSRLYYQKEFNDNNSDWKIIYLGLIVTEDIK